MIEPAAVLETNNHTAAGSKALPNISTAAFIGMAQAQTEEARASLQSYLGKVTEAAGVSPLAATLTPTNDHAALTTGLQCAYNGSMTPAQYQELHVQLEQALAAHPVLGTYHPTIVSEHKADGHVTLSVSVVGLNTQDYAHLIQSLAEQQHAHDIHEVTTGERHEHAHDIHEKMVNAREKVPEKDLRMQGFVERERARPVMGALTRAFHSKRRGVTRSVAGGATDYADDHAHETMLHVDEQHAETLHHEAAQPALAVLGGSRVHMGVVHELAHNVVLGNN